MPNLFVLTEKNDNYSYLVCQGDGLEFIPLFYDIDDIHRTIKAMDITNVKKISADKAELFLYCPYKPIIFTALDRRGLNGVEYYGKKYLEHVLLSREEANGISRQEPFV